MASPTSLPTVSVLTLLLSLIASPQPQKTAQGKPAEPPKVAGVLETEDGTRLPKVDVRVTNVGGGPTLDSGEFTIILNGDYEPGSEIEFKVAGWDIKSPFQGRIWLPKSKTATIHIIVTKIPTPEQHEVLNGLRTRESQAARKRKP